MLPFIFLLQSVQLISLKNNPHWALKCVSLFMQLDFAPRLQHSLYVRSRLIIIPIVIIRTYSFFFIISRWSFYESLSHSLSHFVTPLHFPSSPPPSPTRPPLPCCVHMMNSEQMKDALSTLFWKVLSWERCKLKMFFSPLHLFLGFLSSIPPSLHLPPSVSQY